MSIPAYRVTDDDLPDLDKKTVTGIEPLIEALNRSLGQIVSAVNDATVSDVISLSINTGTNVADSFPILFKSNTVVQPTFVQMICTPKDPNHTLVNPFCVQGFSLTNTGFISIPYITNLLANNTYTLTFLVR